MPRRVLDYDWLHENNMRQAARNEARSLLALEANGCMSPCKARCRSIDATIGVSPREGMDLRAFAVAHPEEREMVDEALKFRRLVAKEVAQQRRAARVAA